VKLCYVTDRKALAREPDEQVRLLLAKIERAAWAGVDWIQIREKDLSGRELMTLVSGAVERVPETCRILVNDRLDVAVACAAGGVHLGEQSIPVEQARKLWRKQNVSGRFLVGASTHSVRSVQAAQESGADYVIFGPVYATPAKEPFGSPQGVERLAEVCESLSLPVIAIGGITLENSRECVAVGAAGIAAIRLFQNAADIAAVVRELRRE
jgi:thiamine-phosphate pyrophosphorylase